MAQTLIWIMDDGQTIDVSGTGHINHPSTCGIQKRRRCGHDVRTADT